MATSLDSTNSDLRAATHQTAVLGALLLLVAVAWTSVYLGTHPLLSQRVVLAVVLGLYLCSVLSLAASWMLHKRHAWSIPVYCISWALNIAGWLVYGLNVSSKQPSFILFVGACFTFIALLLITRAQRELRGSKLPTVDRISKRPASGRIPRFTWWRFTIVVLLLIAIESFFINLLWKTHQITAALAMAIFALSMIGYLGFRFSQLRAALAKGHFDVEQYQRDPATYFRGPTRPFILWMVCTLVVTVGVILL